MAVLHKFGFIQALHTLLFTFGHLSTASGTYTIRNNELFSVENLSLPFSVSVTGNCIYPEPKCVWMYRTPDGVHHTIPISLTIVVNRYSHCKEGQSETTCTLQFTKIPKVFLGKSVFLTLSLSHPSLNGASMEINTKKALKFPGSPVASSAVSRDDFKWGDISFATIVIITGLFSGSMVIIYIYYKNGYFSALRQRAEADHERVPTLIYSI